MNTLKLSWSKFFVIGQHVLRNKSIFMIIHQTVNTTERVGVGGSIPLTVHGWLGRYICTYGNFERI